MSPPRRIPTLAIILLFAACCLLIPMGIVYEHCLKPSINYYQVLDDYTEVHSKESKTNNDNARLKYIVLWTPFFKDPNWYMSNAKNINVFDEKYFIQNKCPVTSCVITSNKTLLSSPHLYDAVLFHFAEPFTWHNKIPNFRSPRQLYVAVSLESPANTKHLIKGDYSFYNWTMTYRLDSDIVWSYKKFQNIETGNFVAPAHHPDWRNRDKNFSNEVYLNKTLQKTKMVAWFVSNCHAKSKRKELAEALQKHIEVDIYGACGTLKCQRKNESNCLQMLESDYKFYLAFENSLCTDYVTEKLFNYITIFIVPIVFGGADYSKFAPPHSYIDANDFNSTQSLADHLIYLDNNPEEYIKYFWWKQYYQVTNSKPFCDLCQQLHYNENIEKRQTYTDFQKWWFGGMCDRQKLNIKF